jgi:hypothetical protein
MAKKAFPMGYKKPKAEAYPRTGSGQKQSAKQRNNRLKAALRAANAGSFTPKPRRPIRKKK